MATTNEHTHWWLASFKKIYHSSVFTGGVFYFTAMNTETLRTLCLQLPAATEDVKREKGLVFSFGGKMFCVTSFEEPFRACFKVPEAVFEVLCTRVGFMPAPYMASTQWVLVSNESGLSSQEWMTFVQASYEMVKSKLTRKLRQEWGLAASSDGSAEKE